MQPIYRTQAPTRPRPTPKPRVWTVWVAFACAMLGVVGGSLLIAAALSVYVAADMRRSGLPIAPGALGAQVVERLHSGPALVASALVSVAVFSALALLGARLSPTPARARLRWDPPSLPRRGVLWGTVGFVAWSMMLGTVIHAAGLDRDGSLREIREVFQHAGWASLWGAVLVVGVGPGLAEELFFRGYLQTRLTQRHGARAGVALASVLFGLAHMDKVHTAFAVLAGLYLGWLSLRARSVVPGVVAHATNNVLSVLLTAFVTEPDDAEYVVPALMIWGGLCAACTVHLMRAPDAKPAAARPSSTRGLVTAAAAILSMLALAVGLKLARPAAIEPPPATPAPVALIEAPVEDPRPVWNAWPTSVEDLHACLAERTRLRPDRRFVRAFTEVDRIHTGREGVAPTLAFADGAWLLRRERALVATLDEVPGFTNAYEALVTYAAAHPAAGDPGAVALPAMPAGDPWATLRALEPSWRAGARDLRVVAPMARALASLCVRAVRPGVESDALFARALAAAAVCRASGHPDARAEALLATAMWYESDARQRASTLPPGDPVRAWVEADDAALAASADAPAPMLRALLVARRGDRAPLDAMLDGPLARDGGAWRALVDERRSRLASDVGAHRVFLEGYLTRVTAAVEGELRGEAAPSATGAPSRRIAALVASAPEDGLVDRALVSAYATAVFGQAWWRTFDFIHDELRAGDGARAFAVESDQGDEPTAHALRRVAELLVDARLRRTVVGELRGVMHTADAESRARLLAALTELTNPEDTALFEGFADLRAALDTRPRHRDLFDDALRRTLRDMVASERWSRLAVDAAPTWLWRASVARLGMTRDARALGELAGDPHADLAARAAAVAHLKRLPDQVPAVNAAYRALVASSPDDAELRMDASDYLLDHNDQAGAMEVVRPWVDAHPGDTTYAGVTMRVRQARILQEMRRFDEAWALIEPTIASGTYAATVRSAMIAADRGHTDVALQLYQRASERFGAVTETARTMEIYWRQGHPELALQLYAMHHGGLQELAMREEIGPAFLRVYGPQPVDAGRAVIEGMTATGLRENERWVIVDVVRKGGRADLALEVALVRAGDGAEDITRVVQTWRLMREARGDERALAWLESRLSRDARERGLRGAAYTEGAYDLLWSALQPPEEHPNEAETLWLYRAAAWAHTHDAPRPDLTEHFTQASPHPYRAMGRYLLGMEPLPAMLALGTSPDRRAEVAYYAGLRAQHEGRLDEASQWFQLVTALGQVREAEDAFAMRQLIAWSREGFSLSPAHALTQADAATPAAPTAPAAPPPPTTRHGAHHSHREHGTHHGHHH